MSDAELPHWGSDLILVAIDDAEKLDRNIYTPRGEVWHGASHIRDSKNPIQPFCSVCFAGTVMAGRLDYDPRFSYDFGEITKSPHADKLLFLDSVRVGDFPSALVSAEAWGMDYRYGTKHCEKFLFQLEEMYAQLELKDLACFDGWGDYELFIKCISFVADVFKEYEVNQLEKNHDKR